jgi:phytoene synthase
MSDEIISRSEEAIAKGSQSFAAAARLFDRQTRDDAVMLYAWCRHCDDVIDGQTLGHEQVADFRNGQQARLEQLRAETRAALSGEVSDSYISTPCSVWWSGTISPIATLRNC